MVGNAYLKWAFSEAAVLYVAKSEHGRTLLKRLERKHGKPKALALLAHKIGRTAYFMLAASGPSTRSTSTPRRTRSSGGEG